MKKKIIVFSVISLLLVVFIFSKYNNYIENREKNLGELFHDVDGFNYLVFELRDGGLYDPWRTDNEQAWEELTEFLSKYQIKKMTDEEWNSIRPKGISFEMSLYSENKVIRSSSFYEERLYINDSVNDSAYRVINGPIDMEWIQKFEDKYKN